jgi:hypothetical protein
VAAVSDDQLAELPRVLGLRAQPGEPRKMIQARTSVAVGGGRALEEESRRQQAVTEAALVEAGRLLQPPAEELLGAGMVLRLQR